MAGLRAYDSQLSYLCLGYFVYLAFLCVTVRLDHAIALQLDSVVGLKL